MTPLKNMI